MERDQWYFAYGSNLHRGQLSRRIKLSFDAADTFQRAYLPNYQLAFNMRGEDGEFYANIVWPGSGVHGVLYRCDLEAFKKLDAYETGYDRREVVVTNEQQEPITAWVYLSRLENIAPGSRPNTTYLQTILKGAREHGLPAEHIQAIELLAWG
ncbi:AIG2-like family protein [Anatilimnocola aggregata]|uniref:AIG2-like family protein n=1 Tax=Anatilimnocola aggregata TaxID=2528021 RepID=A0A517YKP7_9BACT|nr:gamma-glutamylcyclotransferase family protein [Anatilimnocola aggregata]QDU30806.1 AIG2-like family protein [Anatilimnocola aggregata]